MREVAFLLAQAQPAVAGLDWRLLGIPAAVVALVTLLLYFVGAIRPLRITSAEYWHTTGASTHFAFTVRNRSFLFDRELSRVSILVYPTRIERIRHPRWRRASQRHGYVPFGVNSSPAKAGRTRITKRDDAMLEGEIQQGTTPGRFELDGQVRLQVHAGSSRSRPRRIDKAA
jgi:hypothetical protein